MCASPRENDKETHSDSDAAFLAFKQAALAVSLRCRRSLVTILLLSRSASIALGGIFLKKVFFLSFRRRKNVQLCNWSFFFAQKQNVFSDDWFQNPKNTFSSNNRSCSRNCGIKTQSPRCRRTLGQLCDFWPRPPPPPKKKPFSPKIPADRCHGWCKKSKTVTFPPPLMSRPANSSAGVKKAKKSLSLKLFIFVIFNLSTSSTLILLLWYWLLFTLYTLLGPIPRGK